MALPVLVFARAPWSLALAVTQAAAATLAGIPVGVGVVYELSGGGMLGNEYTLDGNHQLTYPELAGQ